MLGMSCCVYCNAPDFAVFFHYSNICDYYVFAIHRCVVFGGKILYHVYFHLFFSVMLADVCHQHI